MKILRIRDVKLPERANPTDAGIDFFIPNEVEPFILRPGQSILIPSGIKANIPVGHALIAFNKSGIAVKKTLLVGACVVDEGYTGEIHIDLKNVGKKEVSLEGGDKVIQLVCLPVNYVNIEEAGDENELFEGKVTERGSGGFGHTGTK